MQEPVFVSAVYGKDYLPFITAHLYSVWRAHPAARHVVLWQDLPAHEIALLGAAFPNVRFRIIENEIEGTSDQKIPRRLHAWRMACEEHDGQPIVFLDCDLLVLHPLDRFLPRDVDVVFTWKDDIFPLNAGVILIRSGEAGRAFLDEWRDKTEALVTDTARLARVRRASGGGSQHTFREIAGWVNYDRVFTRSIRGHEVIFQGVPCAELNETRCVPLTADTHIVHYKSGWHSFLLGKTGYTRTRPEAKCAEMYALWLQMEGDACAHVASRFLESLPPAAPTRPEAGGAAPWLEKLAEALGTELTFVLASCGSSPAAGGARRVELSEPWLRSMSRACQAEARGRAPGDPPALQNVRPAGAAADGVFLLEASLGDSMPAVLTWLLTRKPLPRAVVLQAPDQVPESLGRLIERNLRRSRPAAGAGCPGNLVLFPQEKESRKLAADYPAFGAEGTGGGWLEKVSQLVRRGAPAASDAGDEDAG